ncbi:MAG: hypothetical protein CMC79_03160 [Flavobacteriaceae bacterium]|nr:hypothetical protein [Flavobacteriaceae bacterium]|tara:strand:- start:23014 stop:24630 length:1617 start_codon:yes stop_codon:yes gene_type:complete
MRFIKVLFILFTCFRLNSQVESKVNAGVVSNTITIGSQIDYFLNIEIDSIREIQFPEELLINPLEILEAFPIDSQKVKDKYFLTKRYALIQFDSGYYKIPEQRVLIDGFSKLSNSVEIRVKDIVVDTVKQKLYEIKPIIIVNKNYNELIKKIIFLLLVIIPLICIVYLIINYLRNKAYKKNLVPPFERAIQALKKLEERTPKAQEDFKKYYSDLIDVVRTYFEEETDIDALESTSEELLVKLEMYKQSGRLELESSTIKNLRNVLSTADLVKFAKAIPEKGATNLDRKLVEEIVIETKEVLPEPSIEELKAKEEYEELLRKEKIKKIWKWSIIGFSFSTLIVLCLSIFIYGFYPVIDTIFRYPTKKLIDNEWITSQYGSPPIQLSTPKVLKRRLLKSSTINFVMDSIGDDFFTELFFEQKNKNISATSNEEGNTTNAEETQQLIDNEIMRLEGLGAKNILMEADNYTTPKGLPTLKISGTLDYSQNIDLESERFVFIILIMKHDKGKLSFSNIYKKGDRYGAKLSERIIESMDIIKEL